MIHRLFPLIALAAWTGLALGARAWAEPLPYPKPGQCAGGYYQSGGYCVPKSATSRPAIAKSPLAE